MTKFSMFGHEQMNWNIEKRTQIIADTHGDDIRILGHLIDNNHRENV